MKLIKIVLDTNVFVSALRSSLGAGYKILTLLGSGQFEICISVALVLEYEEIFKRTKNETVFSENDIEDLIDFICSIGRKYSTHYLWRPTLKDPDDEMILELAVASQAEYIVTYNLKDFVKSNYFGIKVITPAQLLKKIGR